MKFTFSNGMTELKVIDLLILNYILSDPWIHGYKIYSLLRQQGDGSITPSNVYARLNRLIEKGLIEKNTTLESATITTRNKYILTITENGKHFIKKVKGALKCQVTT